MTDKQYTAEEMRMIAREAFVDGALAMRLHLPSTRLEETWIRIEALRRYPDIFVGPQIEHIIDQSGNVCHAIRNYPDKEDKNE